MIKPSQAVLLCGGLGTRLRPLTDTLPKPMVPIYDGKPFLHYLLVQLSAKGIKRFVLLVGYLSDVIVAYFGDGHQFGWDITYSEGPVEWDTGRRIWEARPYFDERFLVLYSDNFASFSLDNMWLKHQENSSSISLILKRKIPGNVSLGENNILQVYDKTRQATELNYVELGYMIVEREPILAALENLSGAPDISFSNVIKYFTDKKSITGHPLDTPYYSISDPERLELTKKFLSPRKIVLLDRDGTIHERAPRGEYISKWEDVVLLPEAVEGLGKLAAEGFQFLVISNQAGIGRGILTEDEVNALNNSIQSYFSSIGIDILAFYICPHHWDDNCKCRKPLPGLFYKCASDYDLKLENVLYIGDDPRDCEAADAAGSKCLYVGDPSELIGGAFEDQKVYSGIADTVEEILKLY